MKEISTLEIFAIRLLKSVQKQYDINLTECQIKWAISETLQGAHSLSLFALAGMTSFPNPFEADHYFFKALEELKISIPPEKEAIKNYVIFICKKIVADTLSARAGCEILANICIDLEYEDYNDWCELRDKLLEGRITDAEFENEMRETARHYVTHKKNN